MSTGFDDWWRQLEVEDLPLPYLVIDCSGFDGGAAELPREIFSDIECLVTGQLADELADVAGYLGRIASWRHGAHVRELLARQLAWVLVMPAPHDGMSAPSFAEIHRHLRKFNVVYGPDGKPLFWRYYDPRALPDVLGVLEAGQLSAFFGPAESFAWISRDSELVRARYRAGELDLALSPIEPNLDSAFSKRGGIGPE